MRIRVLDIHKIEYVLLVHFNIYLNALLSKFLWFYHKMKKQEDYVY